VHYLRLACCSYCHSCRSSFDRATLLSALLYYENACHARSCVTPKQFTTSPLEYALHHAIERCVSFSDTKFRILNSGFHSERIYERESSSPVDSENVTNNPANSAKYDLSLYYSLTGSRIGLSIGTEIGDLKSH